MKERKDKVKKVAKVAKELVKDPLLTTREVEEKTWVSKSSVASYIKNDLDKLGQTDILNKILEMDDQIIALSNWLTLDMINEKIKDWKDLTVQDHKIISDIANNSTKRKAIFWKNDDWDKAIQFIIS